jgi:hypothetical protein
MTTQNKPIHHFSRDPAASVLAKMSEKNHQQLLLLYLLDLLSQHRHKALAIELRTKTTNLLAQRRLSPRRSRTRASRSKFASEPLVEISHQTLPSMCGLASSEVIQNPLTINSNVLGHTRTEIDCRGAADLLDGALVECRDGLVVLPVARRWVRVDVFLAVGFGELDDELGFLVGG